MLLVSYHTNFPKKETCPFGFWMSDLPVGHAAGNLVPTIVIGKRLTSILSYFINWYLDYFTDRYLKILKVFKIFSRISLTGSDLHIPKFLQIQEINEALIPVHILEIYRVPIQIETLILIDEDAINMDLFDHKISTNLFNYRKLTIVMLWLISR